MWSGDAHGSSTTERIGSIGQYRLLDASEQRTAKGEWHLLKRKRQFGTGRSRSKHAVSRAKADVSESFISVIETENASLGLK